MTTTGQTTATGTEQKVDQMQDMPIVLNLTLRKVNYILKVLSQLPYKDSFQPITDIQNMVVEQVKAAQEAQEALNAAKGTTESTESV